MEGTFNHIEPAASPRVRQPADPDSAMRSRLKDAKKTIWLTRPDLRGLCGGDKEQFDWWLFLHGAEEYRIFEEFGDAGVFPVNLSEVAKEALPGVWPPLTKAMLFVWKTRPDLQQIFDLTTRGRQQDFVDWLLFEGSKESEQTAKVAFGACRGILSERDPIAHSSVKPTLTKLMHLVWRMRPDLHAAFNLHTVEGQRQFIRWYFVHGIPELNAFRYVTDEQRRLLNEPDLRFPTDTGTPITLLLTMIWQQRADLQQVFPLDDPENRNRFVE